MKRRDARKLSREAQAELRLRACTLIERQGMTQAEVGNLLDVHPDTVSRWWTAYKRDGTATFEARPGRGRPSRTMAPEHVAWIVETVTTTSPRDHGFESPLWALKEMQAALQKQFQLTVPISTLHRTVRGAGLRSRVPRKQATERRDAEVERWVSEVWPTVTEAAAEGAKVMFLDEAQVRADAPLGKTWSKRGTRPVVKATGKRPRVNIVSAVSWDGDLLFGTYEGSFNAAMFIGFLQHLLTMLTGDLVIVLDGLRVHFAAPVKEFLKTENGKRLRLVQLPAYAPDLNPDEHVWSFLKGHAMKRYPIKQDERIREVVEDEMSQIAARPQLVRSFFGHPDVSYLHAAAGVGAR